MKQKSLKNFVIIFFLGFSSGLPLSLTSSSLQAMLQDQGFDVKTIGFLALVGSIYSLKFLFSPVIDSFRIPILSKFLGQRKSWIFLSQITIALFIATVGVSSLSHNILIIAIFALLLAFCSASQDIVIDGYRIELIAKDEQGLAASFYTYGYYIALLVAGAGSLKFSEKIGWLSVYLILALLMLSTTIITIFFADETRKNFKPKSYDFLSWFRNYVIEPLIDFSKHHQWHLILLFIVLFKFGDAFAGNITLFFLKEIGFSNSELADIVKVFGTIASFSGIFIGGLLVKKTNIITSLWIAGILQMISNLSFAYLAQIGHNPQALYFVIFAENFSGGIGSAVFIAYLSGLCNISFSTTQYALLSSLATVGRTFLVAPTGIFADAIGWFNFFLLSTAVALPGMILLFLITRKKQK